jgi:hypothetical protein
MALAAVPRASVPPVVTTDDLLRELIAEVRGLREDMRAGRVGPSLSRADRLLLAKMLPAIGGVFGSELFNSAEVCEHDAAALRLVCRGLTVKQFGRLLRRGAGTPINGYAIEREGTEAGAVLWRVVKVP